ncbi:hypothetical protein [Bdellovibrio sp. HCB337]|uniref:hypothetical protein n=1 Tax=Bdellovibrio sp. HCB337 TaxID=3394358 RepID=UPI0039A45AAA
MKTINKIFIGAFTFVFVSVITIFAINATDVPQTELTRQMLQKFPAQEGFSMLEFKTVPEEKRPQLDFEKYSDYTKDPAKYDELIKTYYHFIEKSERAFQIGRVAVNPDATIFDGFATYSVNSHKLFLVFLSQKIAQGKMNEAMDLLEKSNHFFASIVQTPQVYIQKMISLRHLRQNAEFALKLKEAGVLKKAPATLKESFKLTQTPQKIWEDAGKMEFLMASSVVLAPDAAGFFEMTNIDGSGENQLRNAAKKTVRWFMSKLYRPNQTLNDLSEGYSIFKSPECAGQTPKKCGEALDRIAPLEGKNLIINPWGKSLVRTFLPRFAGTYTKVEISSQDLLKASEAL